MSKVWVFAESTLEAALEDWLNDQAARNPQKVELVPAMAVAVREFLNSPQATEHKMIMNAPVNKPKGT